MKLLGRSQAPFPNQSLDATASETPLWDSVGGFQKSSSAYISRSVFLSPFSLHFSATVHPFIAFHDCHSAELTVAMFLAGVKILSN